MPEIPALGLETVRVSYDATVAVLTAVFDPTPAVDIDDVVDDFVAFFDRQQAGRLARLQVLVPDDRRGAWRTILPDYLGPTVAGQCLAHIDTSRQTSQETMVIPPVEWTDLRYGQWPHLHAATRCWLGADPLPAGAVPDTTAAGIDSQLVHAAPPDPNAEFPRTEARLLPGFAYRCGVEPVINISMIDGVARLVAVPRSGAVVRLSAVFVHPEPIGDESAGFRRDGRVAVAVLAIQEPTAMRGVPRVVVHFVRRSARTREPTEGAVVLMLRDTRRTILADREVSKAVGFAGVKTGSTSESFSFRGSGRSPVRVEVIRQGRFLWARGFAGRSRRTRAVFVACRLRADVVESLRPNGSTDPDAGVLSGEGAVDDEGYFQVRLATVDTRRVRGKLVESLELEVG
jgi:hypothetical protein